ncbi:nitroreductase family protein [Bacillus litorisediminis]|uniref:nitroreductase family protein n=1 Tax=Bacillus litorisediminis TaxID=2922713 RepID=UPI001FAF7962|nr:nitroreductase family protein [Bacillus litorisediminis]
MSNSQAVQQLVQKNFFDVIRERRSVRSYDPSFRISREELTDMLQQATLAPSSSNLQPWRFLVIDSPELKEKLLPIANNQQQVTEASAIIAVLGDTESYRMAGKIYGQAVEAGFMSEEVAKSFVERTTSTYSSLPAEVARQIVSTDAGLVSMQLMLIARAKGYDTVPMGGYNKAKFVESFGIPERYIPIILIAIGKAAKPGHPTTRLPIGDIVSFNKFSE